MSETPRLRWAAPACRYRARLPTHPRAPSCVVIRLPSMTKSAPVKLPVRWIAKSSTGSTTSRGRVKRPVIVPAAGLATDRFGAIRVLIWGGVLAGGIFCLGFASRSVRALD